MGTEKVRTLEDQWTIVTEDGMPSAHFEHDIAIVDGKAEILSTFDYIYDVIDMMIREKKFIFLTVLTFLVYGLGLF